MQDFFTLNIYKSFRRYELSGKKLIDFLPEIKMCRPGCLDPDADGARNEMDMGILENWMYHFIQMDTPFAVTRRGNTLTMWTEKRGG